MIAMSITTQETNSAQNASAFARRYQQAMRPSARFNGMTQQTNNQSFYISRRWDGHDYHGRTEQASRKGRAA